MYVHQKRSHTSISHPCCSSSNCVSSHGVPFEAQSVLTIVNHLRSNNNNISRSRRAGETVTQKWTSSHSWCCENMAFDGWKANIPWGHRARVVSDPGLLNRQLLPMQITRAWGSVTSLCDLQTVSMISMIRYNVYIEMHCFQSHTQYIQLLHY